MTRASKSLSTLGTIAAATTLAAATASPVEAATIIQDFSGSNGSIFALQQFNSSLGNLQSVDIAFSPFAVRNVANPQPEAGIASFTLRGHVDLTSADVGAPTLPSWERTINRTSNKLNPFYELSVGGPTQATSLTSGFNDFIGSSLFNYTVNGGVDILSSSAPLGETTLNTGRAALRVTYNYNEAAAAVPEPATWATMSAGFGLVGAAMRRRKSNDAAPTPAV